MHHLFSSYEFFQKGLADEKQFYSFADLLENAYQKVIKIFLLKNKFIALGYNDFHINYSVCHRNF